MTDVEYYADRLDDVRLFDLDDAVDLWSARDLMNLAGYDRWENFSKAINRAIASVNASGLDAAEHFRGVTKSSPMPRGGFREVGDVQMTKHGAYVLFQNADGSKPQIAAIQRYFSVAAQSVEQSREVARGVPQTFAEALREFAAEVEAHEQTKAELEVAAPRAEAWDAIASAEGDYSVGDAAKMLARAGIPTGPQRLFNQMGDIKWTFRGEQGKWRAYAERVDKGYLSERPQFHYHPETGERVVDPPQIRVTVKGIERLRQRLHVGSLRAVGA